MILALFFASFASALNPLERKITLNAAPGLEFHAICKAAKLPCAIEIDSAVSGSVLGRSPLLASEETVSGAMRRAILRYPGHRWRLRKGVIYVTPNEAVPGTPLDRPLERDDFEGSIDTLRETFGAAAGFCSVPASAAVDVNPVPPKKISFSLDEATPRSVLNGFVFQQGQVPPAIPLYKGSQPSGTPVTPAEFARLAQIPVQVVYGDNIPKEPIPDLVADGRRAQVVTSRMFVDALNQQGGNASVLHLPDVGQYGNSHFMFSDLNNVAVADQLSLFLQAKGLDIR